MAREVLVEVDRRGVATLTLNRPKVMNAFDAAQIDAFNAAMAKVTDDVSVRVIVIAGKGRVFCSGADIRYLRQAGDLPFDENLADGRRYAQMSERIRDCAKPVVARVQGGAYGGGVAIAAACDVVIAGRSAKLAITEARYGLTPSLMVPYLLGRIGQRGCRRWCLTGEVLDAEAASRFGLVDIVVEDDKLDAEVERVCDTLLMIAPGGLAESKAVVGAMGRPPVDAAARERSLRAFVEGRASPQAVEGARAFLERRHPSWAVRKSR